MKSFLFAKKDNIALVLFRIMFGLLIVAESWGAIMTGWVHETFVEPDFTFTFFGMEWTEFLVGEGMYAYFIIMGIVGWGVVLGYRYRLSTLIFTIMWSIVYLMQKSHYNNHYYLLVLVSAFFFFVPAHQAYSLDAKRNPEIRSDECLHWHLLLFKFQILLVYIFATWVKIYPDWLIAAPTKLFLKYKSNYEFIGPYLQNEYLPYFLAYGGILFDLLFVPLVYFKKTRNWAFGLALFFHLFNSLVFRVGIFPYMGIAFAIFYYPTNDIRRWFIMPKIGFSNPLRYKSQNLTIFVFVSYLLIQIALPIRHYFIPGDVLWTEEGHRLSWRMMLRTKSSSFRMYTYDPKTKKRNYIKLTDYVTPNQAGDLKVKPDMMWTLARRIKKENDSLEVRIRCRISVNGRKYAPYIDESVDIGAVEWNHFKPNPWILPPPDDFYTELHTRLAK